MSNSYLDMKSSDSSDNDLPPLIEDESDDSISDKDYIPDEDEINDLIDNENDVDTTSVSSDSSYNPSENESESDMNSESSYVNQLFQMQIYKDNTMLWKKYCNSQKQKLELDKKFGILEEKFLSKYNDMRLQRNTVLFCCVLQQLVLFWVKY